jgi:hypothetical protein
MSRATYRKQRAAILAIQSATRLSLAKSKLQQLRTDQTERKAAARIQKAVRGSFTRTKFNEKKSSALLLQSMTRRYIATNRVSQMQRLKTENIAALTIQKTCRGARSQATYRKQRAAILIIQSSARRSLAKSQLQHLRTDHAQNASATCIQKSIRGSVARTKFIEKKSSVVVIQSMLRRNLANIRVARLRKVKVENTAALAIQKVSRKAVARATYKKKKASIVKIQSTARLLLAKHLLLQLRTSCVENHAATNIQRYQRGSITQTKYNKKKASALTIESMARTFLARRQFAQLYIVNREKREASVVAVQPLSQCTIVSPEVVKLQNISYAQEACEPVKLRHVECETNAALSIQKASRRNLARTSFKRKMESVVKIQSLGRREIAKRELIILRKIKFLDAEQKGVIIRQELRKTEVQSKVKDENAGLFVTPDLKKVDRSQLTHKDLTGGSSEGLDLRKTVTARGSITPALPMPSKLHKQNAAFWKGMEAKAGYKAIEVKKVTASPAARMAKETRYAHTVNSPSNYEGEVHSRRSMLLTNVGRDFRRESFSNRSNSSHKAKTDKIASELLTPDLDIDDMSKPFSTNADNVVLGENHNATVEAADGVIKIKDTCGEDLRGSETVIAAGKSDGIEDKSTTLIPAKTDLNETPYEEVTTENSCLTVNKDIEGERALIDKSFEPDVDQEEETLSETRVVPEAVSVIKPSIENDDSPIESTSSDTSALIVHHITPDSTPSKLSNTSNDVSLDKLPERPIQVVNAVSPDHKVKHPMSASERTRLRQWKPSAQGSTPSKTPKQPTTPMNSTERARLKAWQPESDQFKDTKPPSLLQVIPRATPQKATTALMQASKRAKLKAWPVPSQFAARERVPASLKPPLKNMLQVDDSWRDNLKVFVPHMKKDGDCMSLPIQATNDTWRDKVKVKVSHPKKSSSNSSLPSDVDWRDKIKVHVPSMCSDNESASLTTRADSVANFSIANDELYRGRNTPASTMWGNAPAIPESSDAPRHSSSSSLAAPRRTMPLTGYAMSSTMSLGNIDEADHTESEQKKETWFSSFFTSSAAKL